MKLHALAFLALFLPLSAPAALQLVGEGKNQNFLYEHDPKALVSSVQFVLRTGNLADPKGKEGLASLSFESLLRGTKKKNRQEFFAAVERLGATIGVDTASNRTIIHLGAISENLPEALGLLAEAVLQPGLKSSEIQSLATERLAQLNQELSNNRALLRRVFRQGLFAGTALAFPPEGTIDGVRAIAPDDVRTFLSQQIKAGNVVVAAVSNHEEKEVRGWIESAFASLPDGNAPALAVPKFTPPEGRTLYVLDRKGSSTTEVALGHLGITADRADRALIELGIFVLGEDMTSRLFQILRAKNGWTYGAFAGFRLIETPRRHGSAFLIYTFPQAEHTEKATLKAIEIYGDYIQKGLTAKELAFAKQSLTNSYPFQFATSQARLTARLYSLLDGAPLPTVAEYRKLVNAITLAEMKKSIQGAHDPKNLVIAIVGDPEKTAALKKSIPNLKAVKVVTDPMKAIE